MVRGLCDEEGEKKLLMPVYYRGYLSYFCAHKKIRGLGFFSLLLFYCFFFLCCRNKSLLDLIMWGFFFLMFVGGGFCVRACVEFPFSERRPLFRPM